MKLILMIAAFSFCSIIDSASKEHVQFATLLSQYQSNPAEGKDKLCRRVANLVAKELTQITTAKASSVRKCDVSEGGVKYAMDTTLPDGRVCSNLDVVATRDGTHVLNPDVCRCPCLKDANPVA